MNAVQVKKSETKVILKALFFISILWGVLVLANDSGIMTPSVEKSPEQKQSNTYEAKVNIADLWAEQLKVNVK